MVMQPDTSQPVQLNGTNALHKSGRHAKGSQHWAKNKVDCLHCILSNALHETICIALVNLYTVLCMSLLCLSLCWYQTIMHHVWLHISKYKQLNVNTETFLWEFYILLQSTLEIEAVTACFFIHQQFLKMPAFYYACLQGYGMLINANLIFSMPVLKNNLRISNMLQHQDKNFFLYGSNYVHVCTNVQKARL